jgi:hypothetical protein
MYGRLILTKKVTLTKLYVILFDTNVNRDDLFLATRESCERTSAPWVALLNTCYILRYLISVRVFSEEYKL